MKLLGRNSNSDDSKGPFRGSTGKAPRDSAARGEHCAFVNGEETGNFRTRGEARQAARNEAARLNREDRGKWGRR